jgi:inorganic pyrophosphatase
MDVFVEIPRGSRATYELDRKIIDASRKRKKTRA